MKQKDKREKTKTETDIGGERQKPRDRLSDRGNGKEEKDMESRMGGGCNLVALRTNSGARL